MSAFLPTLRSAAKAAVVALALGAVAMPPLPAQAQPTLTLDFGIKGGGASFSFGIGRSGKKFKRDCLTNREIRRGLRRAGFEDIQFVDRQGVRVVVIAEWGRHDYRLVIHRCKGVVLSIKRIRGHDWDDDWDDDWNDGRMDRRDRIELELSY